MTNETTALKGQRFINRLSQIPVAAQATLIIGFAIGLRLCFFTGISSADDLSVADAAFKLLENGVYLPEGHYDSRLMMVYPLAAIFALFGSGEWQMALLPFLASIVSSLCAYSLATYFVNERAALWALFAAAVFPLDVFYSTQFMPDGYLGAFLAAAFVCAVKAKNNANREMLLAIAAGAVWGMAYLIKIEAAFLVFPMAVLYLWGNNPRYKLAIYTAVACGFFVVGENLIYWLQTGEILYRLKLIAISTPMITSEEYRGSQLWVFPKAWFITFYQFSLHYYFFFAGMLCFFISKRDHLGLVVFWALIYLIWLQFGGNPFDEELHFKSHLMRYCLMLATPTFIMIGYYLDYMSKWKKARISLVVVWSALSFFLIIFNVLSAEREMASKKLIRETAFVLDKPIYMDSGSYGLARFLAKAEAGSPDFQLFQKHNFKTSETKLISPQEVDGYILYNKGFVEHRANRYFMKTLNLDELSKACVKIKEISNPASRPSYFSAWVLKTVANFIPLASLKNKIISTATGLLQDQDATLWKCF